MRSMKSVRAIMFFVAFAVLCGGGVARAQEDAPEAPVVVAQAGGNAAAYSDDSDPATKGDLRRLQGDFGRLWDAVGELRGDVIRLDERMDAQERELRHLREEVGAIRDEMHSNFKWLMGAILIVLGLPQFFGLLGRWRGNGRSVAAGVFMVALPAAAIVAALLLTDNAAAQENESAPVVRAQSEQGDAAARDNLPATLGDLRESEDRINGQMGRLEKRMGERMERMESRMGERMDRMDGRMLSLHGAVMGVHDALYALIFTLIAGLGGGIAVMFGILLKDRRKGMISGAAATAFMLIVGGLLVFGARDATAAKAEREGEESGCVQCVRPDSEMRREDA